MRGVGILALVIAACTANDDIHPPRIASIAPDPATAGGLIQIHGSFFCAQPEPDPDEEVDPLHCEHTGTVVFASEHVTAASYADALVMVEVPGSVAGVVDVSMAVEGRISNRVALTVE